MLDEKDLQAIAQLIRMETEPLKEEIGDMRTEIVKINLNIENSIEPQIQTLVEGQQTILEMLIPRSRVDDLEEEVKFLKSLYRQMSEDLQKLKKAN